jgi:O-6-methylguanine DNA methyltransferase
MTIQTTWGCIQVTLDSGSVAGCTLPLLTAQPDMPFAVLSCGRNTASRFVVAALKGKEAPRPSFRTAAGTDFQRQVWQAIAGIPPGKTKTYGELAQTIGRPRACRAVANACGKNPLPLFIPCHRVVAANGRIGGFSAGLPWKRLLLSAEQHGSRV